MNIVFIVSLLSLSCYAEYQSAKIDMHGGKDSYMYDKKRSGFGNQGVGMSMFMDKNTTKKTKEAKTEK